MKKHFRRMAAFMILVPGMSFTYFLSVFIGKEAAVKLSGPFFTLVTKPFARSWVPKIKSAHDFEAFAKKMEKKIWLWKPFFDVSIIQDHSDVYQLKVTYCPIYDVLKTLGLSDLAPFVCEADWQVAKENEDKWHFKRNYQLSTGHYYCDHTYIRKIEQVSADGL